MDPLTIALDAAGSTDNLRALEEVCDFSSTDMGRGGRERWTFRILQEPALTAELQRLSGARSYGVVDSVTFQPCLSDEGRNQDRYSVEEWVLPGGVWLYSAVYDGHAGHATVDYVAETLPSRLKEALRAALLQSGGTDVPPSAIAKILSEAVVGLDVSIESSFLELFLRSSSGGIETLTEDQIHGIANAPENCSKVVRCLQGSTLLLSLTDPARQNVWIANLGDSKAVFAQRNGDGDWSAAPINVLHNASNAVEVDRILRDHPGEDECVLHQRVVGCLEPTRAIGDTWLKIPSQYTDRVFSKLAPELAPPFSVKNYSARNLSPPYISNMPEIYHRALASPGPGRVPSNVLILCTDGLLDLYDEYDCHEMVDHWVDIVTSPANRTSSSMRANAAMRLLRDALGGEDTLAVSRNMTVEMDEKWMDDITIITHIL